MFQGGFEMKKVLTCILTLVISCMFSVSAMAQTSLEAFFDKVIAASQLPSCDETLQALNKISDAEFEQVANDAKLLRNQEDLKAFELKFQQFKTLSSKCPAVQDAFANRLSLLSLHASLNKNKEATPEALAGLQAFGAECSAVAAVESCAAAAEKMRQVPRKLCDDAIVGFQTVEPARLPEKTYASIAHGIEAVMNRADSCPELMQAYRKCLMPSDAEPSYLPESRILPLFNWLNEVKRVFLTASCEEIASGRIVMAHEPAAVRAVSGLKPSQFSPQVREKLLALVREVHQAADRCPGADKWFDARIDAIFAK